MAKLIDSALLYLYKGSSSPSLNQSTMNTASDRSIGVMSQGRRACLESTPCTAVIGTGTITTRRQLINVGVGGRSGLMDVVECFAQVELSRELSVHLVG